ncbi:MAG: DUF4494 domain-containing protein [Sodaliphilus sp.]|jgi:hypothetical protein|nr:DUF4494 domain-containing protein [Muribaculaceae bacterium]MCI6079868.1 DUF4494 domain-containing protein [Bacteroidales bacterium]MDY2593106.1 DUF4494 domain-containing protein [Sodaliphilus sp.]MCI6146238.1 DUF4494 domain-containing protein [Bacteroidales bacterium]MCI6224492.1 DUF4494 domain-containing protein [Bacteroidales bacterium]
MSQWFETKVKYDKTMLDTGAIKSVTEPYLVDALSFTEAEARITKEMEPFVSGELTVTAVRKVRFEDVLYHEGGDRWYKVKINMITIDEKTGAEKRSASFSLVQASEFKLALDYFLEAMKSVLFDFEIVNITEMAYIDVFGADLGGGKVEE